MKILVIHNAYQQRGGEDVVAELEPAILRGHSHEVRQWTVFNDSVTGLQQKLRAALGTVFSLRAYRQALALIDEFRPDVVHVHNFFPLLSPSVFHACSKAGVPVVFTLHNYRILCPTALLMHDGRGTERSLDEGPWWALKHRVYRDSFVGTFLLCLMIAVHRRIGTWRSKVDRFILLSEFARSHFIRVGVPADALVVKPNSVDIAEPCSTTRAGLLFVGRLSPEKGIDTLLAATELLAADAKHGLVSVAGTGPLAQRVADSGVRYLGQLPGDQVLRGMGSTLALLVPSVWNETFGLVVIEAFACRTAVIASRIGALAELVEDGVTGMLFEPGNATELAEKMQWALDHPEQMQRMGEAARQRYESRYAPERNYEQLMAVYRDAIESNRNHRE